MLPFALVQESIKHFPITTRENRLKLSPITPMADPAKGGKAIFLINYDILHILMHLSIPFFIPLRRRPRLKALGCPPQDLGGSANMYGGNAKKQLLRGMSLYGQAIQFIRGITPAVLICEVNQAGVYLGTTLAKGGVGCSMVQESIKHFPNH